jgi:hypothetical protein
MLVANTISNCPEKGRNEGFEFLFTNPRSQERLTIYALSGGIHKTLVQAGLVPNNTYSIKSAAVSFLVSQDVPQHQIEQALHYRKGKSVMSAHYATMISLKKLPLLLAQSVNTLYSEKVANAEVSPPDEKPEVKYERKQKSVIEKRKKQLSKELDDKIKKRKGGNE